MSVIRKMSPHAAILIANMYYVLFGIDRVNTAMNFINNGYTKFLLLALLACFVFVFMGLLRRHEERKGDGNDLQRLIPITLNAFLCLAVAIIMLVDVILGNRGMPFLSEIVKFVVLAMCIVTWINAFRLIAIERTEIRAEQARRAAARRRQQRGPAPQRRPAPRSRYAEDYSASGSRYSIGDSAGRSRYAQDNGYSSRSRYAEDERYARSSRYGEGDGYSAPRSRYSDGDGYSASRSRYADDNGYSSSRSRYSDGDYSRSRYSSARSGYASEDGIRRTDNTARSSRYPDGGSARSSYAGEDGIRRTARYTDSDY